MKKLHLNRTSSALLIVFALLMGVILWAFISSFKPGITTDLAGNTIDKPMQLHTTPDREVLITDGVKHTIPLDKILSGGPPKDGIPPIDSPKFETVSKANEYLKDEGLGIAISRDGIDRFYPFQILVWHEIVNDSIAGQRMLVTYCPLCGTGIVFNPTVEGKQCEFGTSGKLYQSNLIMYDRCTDTYWSQALGEAIVGDLAGTKLELLPYQNMQWKQWKKQHPDGQVLSRDTGHHRNYKQSPYGSYNSNTSLYFPVDNQDDRYHLKEPTWGLDYEGIYKVYPLTELQRGPATFSDSLNGTSIRVNYNEQDNTIRFSVESTDKEIIPFYGFWFSWIAVHPNTLVYTAK